MDAASPATSTTRHAARSRIRPCDTHAFVRELLADDLHAQRVLSIGNGVVGVIHAAALSIYAIGFGLAQAAGLSSKHSIKQVDRLLSNAGFDVWALFAPWVEFVLASRAEIIVALDWTEFDKDDHATIALYLVTTHGRATPLLWKTHRKSDLPTTAARGRTSFSLASARSFRSGCALRSSPIARSATSCSTSRSPTWTSIT